MVISPYNAITELQREFIIYSALFLQSYQFKNKKIEREFTYGYLAVAAVVLS